MIDNTIINAASAQAIRSGYDQAIYLDKQKQYRFTRTTAVKNMKKSKIKAIVKLVYRDGMLNTKMVAI